MRRVLVAATAVLALGGCVRLLPESTPSDIYRLTLPPSTADVSRTFGNPTVMVGRPGGGPLGADDIIVSQSADSLAVAAGARWASPAREMVQDYIIEMLEREAPSISPLRPGDGMAADYDLALDIRHFEAEYDRGMEAAPLIHVAIGARLIDEARDLQASSVFSASERAGSNRMGSIVEAFDRATAQTVDTLADWTERSVAESERRLEMERLAEEQS